MVSKDKFIKARVDEKQLNDLEKIAAELQEKMPYTNVSVSSVVRYAVHKYIEEYEKGGIK